MHYVLALALGSSTMHEYVTNVSMMLIDNQDH